MVTVHPAFATISDDCYYTVYNMETKETTYHCIDSTHPFADAATVSSSPQISLKNGSSISPATIIGADNRGKITNTTINPYKYVVHILITTATGTQALGSGVMIGSRAILTAAHAVYNRDGYAQQLVVTPGKNGSQNPYGTYTITSGELFVPSAYTSAFPESASEDFYPGPDYDWAIIYLDTDIGDTTGWPALNSQAASYTNLFVYNIGYPSASLTSGQAAGNTYMFQSTGTIRNVYTYTFTGDWDSVGGNSGGPILVYDSTNGWTLYGIFVSEAGSNGSNYDSSSTFNCARKITGTLWYLCNELGGS